MMENTDAVNSETQAHSSSQLVEINQQREDLTNFSNQICIRENDAIKLIEELQKKLKSQTTIIKIKEEHIQSLMGLDANPGRRLIDGTYLDTVNKPHQQIFSNVLIMETIFDYLDFRSVKNVRLVSTEWNTHATKILSNKSHLKLNEMFKKPLKNLTSIPKVSKALVKNIVTDFKAYYEEINDFDSSSDDDGPSDASEEYDSSNYDYAENFIYHPFSEKDASVSLTLPQQIIAFCEKYKTCIRNIQIRNSRGNDVIRAIRTILNETCPNLESLSLNNYGRAREEMEKIIFIKNFLPTLKLKSFTLMTKFSHDFARHLEVFVNKIICASPYLLELEIRGNIYPDLSSNVKLQTLKMITENDLKHSDGRCQFDLTKLERMIGQCKGTLRNLHLIACNWNPAEDFAVTFTLPELLELNTLVIDGAVSYPLESIEFLKNCPNLLKLEIIGLEKKTLCLDKLFTNSPELMKDYEHTKLTTLELGRFQHVSVLENVIAIFPNLKKLSFQLGIKTEKLDSKGIDTQINAAFATCAQIKLEELEIQTNYWYYQLADLAKAFLIQSQFFEGLKVFQFINGSSKHVSQFGGKSKEMQNAFILTQNMRLCRLVNFHMKMSIASVITKFITEMKLPVTFE